MREGCECFLTHWSVASPVSACRLAVRLSHSSGNESEPSLVFGKGAFAIGLAMTPSECWGVGLVVGSARFVAAGAAGGGVTAAAPTACFVCMFTACVVAGKRVTAGAAGAAGRCVPAPGAFAASTIVVLRLRLVLVRAVVSQLVGSRSGYITVVTDGAYKGRQCWSCRNGWACKLLVIQGEPSMDGTLAVGKVWGSVVGSLVEGRWVGEVVAMPMDFGR